MILINYSESYKSEYSSSFFLLISVFNSVKILRIFSKISLVFCILLTIELSISCTEGIIYY
ncbi:hypothetical protein AMVITR02b [Betaentomopoxvirus amoorei]|uniref:AMVITR02 n=1 Tax=Amsacta moorei entomopoxvirus TaxID=28321 RepID=Q9DGS1_AMEPV|nr:hypothetical protein AMVITR02a [Amsacta moorei entomopoxvirus]NP_065060.1 hypothetical protein AMVITR02b [Amsacta moorei entomopoxvirus]AAG02974.1 AMVITR02 [Amsacta moorei entomopoxvirus]AAG02986.1 AMVITR02 [Amsacta moorei entomopoxvirus]